MMLLWPMQDQWRPRTGAILSRWRIADCVCLMCFGCVVLPACSPGGQEKRAPTPARITVPSPTNADQAPKVVLERIEEFRSKVLDQPDSAKAWGDLGQTFEVHHFSGQAATCYRQASRLAPEDFRWPYFLGCCLSVSDQAGAIEALERATRLDPEYAPAQIRLGDAYLRSDRVDDAERAYRKALETDPFSAFAYLGSARVAVVRDRFEEAADQVESAIEVRDDFREAHRLAAQVYSRLGKPEQARLETERAGEPGDDLAMPDRLRAGLAEFGVSAGWRASRGESFAAEGDYNRAIAEFRAAVRLEPEIAGHHFRLASALQSAGKRKAALAEYAESLRLRPDYPESHFKYAVLLTQVGQKDKAVEQYRAALEDNPGMTDARENLGALLASMGRYTEGVEALRQVAVEKPDSANVRFNLGLALLHSGDPEAARKVWKNALAIDPDHGPALTELGQLAVRRGDLNEAINLFRRALETDSTRAESYNNLGIALSMAGQLREAVRVFRDGLKKMPNHAGMYNKLAWILATANDDSLRDGPEALRMAERLCKETGFRHPAFLETLAAAQAEAGYFDQASETLRTAIELMKKSGGQPRQIGRFKRWLEQCARHRSFREFATRHLSNSGVKNNPGDGENGSNEREAVPPAAGERSDAGGR